MSKQTNESMTKLRLAIVGLGRVFQHYKTFLNSTAGNSIEIIAVCDLIPEKKLEITEYPNTNFYQSYAELLLHESQNLDAVLILTPSGSHYELIVESVQANVPVICEKPLCLRIDEVKELQRLSSSREVPILPIMQNRRNPSVIKAKSLLGLGVIGKVLGGHVRLRWSRGQEYYDDGWHGTFRHDGGVVSQQAIHHLDALDYLVGPFRSVFAKGRKATHKLEAEDYAAGLITAQDERIYTFETTTCIQESDYEASISIVGTNGEISIRGIALNELYLTTFREGIWTEEKLIDEQVKNGYGNGHLAEVSEYIELILSGSKDKCKKHFEKGYSSVRIINAVYASMELQREVELGISSKLLGR